MKQADVDEVVSDADEVEHEEEEVTETDEVEESTDGGPEESEGETEAEEVTVSFGDEESPTSEEEEKEAPPWVREVRKQSREKDREIRELREKLKAVAQAEVKPVVELGKKPTLADCDYDEEVFDSKLEQWHQRKAEVAAHEAKQKAEQAEIEKAWQSKLDRHSKLKSALPVKDFEDAEAAVMDEFSQVQRGIIIDASADSAKLFYALGKNPKKLKEFASIKNPVEFAWKLSKLEDKMTVSPRKTAPLPERKISGSASTSGVTDSKLARLEAEAEKSKDRSKVIAYRRELRAKGK